MHARDLIELGALVSVHAPTLLRTPSTISDTTLDDYWAASKCRMDRWSRVLKAYSVPVDPPVGENNWAGACSTLEEILTGELLTRVWAGLVTLRDRALGSEQGIPIVRSVFVGHLEARHRALNLLVYGRPVCLEESVRMDRVRRRTERWTDMLLANLWDHGDVREFTVDSHRALEFADDARRCILPVEQTWSLVLASIRGAYQDQLSTRSPNPDLNRRIAGSVLPCLPSPHLAALGLPKSLWLERLCSAARDSEEYIEQLLAMETSSDLPRRDMPPWR